jgi:hypothetical protein
MCSLLRRGGNVYSVEEREDVQSVEERGCGVCRGEGGLGLGADQSESARLSEFMLSTFRHIAFSIDR